MPGGAEENSSFGGESSSVGLLGGAPKKKVECSDELARKKLACLVFDEAGKLEHKDPAEAKDGEPVRYVRPLTLKREIRRAKRNDDPNVCARLYALLGWKQYVEKKKVSFDGMRRRLLGLFGSDEELSDDRCALHDLVEASFREGGEVSQYFPRQEVVSLGKSGAVDEMSEGSEESCFKELCEKLRQRILNFELVHERQTFYRQCYTAATWTYHEEGHTCTTLDDMRWRLLSLFDAVTHEDKGLPPVKPLQWKAAVESLTDAAWCKERRDRLLAMKEPWHEGMEWSVVESAHKPLMREVFQLLAVHHRGHRWSGAWPGTKDDDDDCEGRFRFVELQDLHRFVFRLFGWEWTKLPRVAFSVAEKEVKKN